MEYGRIDGEGDAVGGGVERDEIGMRAELEKGGCEERRGHICVVLEAPSEVREDGSEEGVPQPSEEQSGREPPPPGRTVLP